MLIDRTEIGVSVSAIRSILIREDELELSNFMLHLHAQYVTALKRVDVLSRRLELLGGDE